MFSLVIFAGKVATSTFKYPASELALIVHACHSIGVTPTAEIVLLADKTVPAPVPVVVAPVAAPQPVVSAAPVTNSSASMQTSQAAPRVPRADKPATAGGKDARTAAVKTENTRRDRDGNNKTGAKRHNDAQKSEVDTVSAIQQLERSCLQKPSTGSAPPVKVAAAPLSTRTVPAPRAAGVPVSSVWKVPTTSPGVAESKSETGESVKTLKEIQVSGEL